MRCPHCETEGSVGYRQELQLTVTLDYSGEKFEEPKTTIESGGMIFETQRIPTELHELIDENVAEGNYYVKFTKTAILMCLECDTVVEQS